MSNNKKIRIGVTALLGAAVLAATAAARPKIKLRLDGGQKGKRAQFLAKPGGELLVTTLEPKPRWVERMGLAAAPSGIETLEVWFVTDTAEEPREGEPIFEDETTGKLTRRIEIGQHFVKSLGSRAKLRDELVRLAAYIGEPGDEGPGCGMHLMNMRKGPDETRFLGIAFTEGWALYQIAHVSQKLRRHLVNPVQMVDGEHRASELPLGELLGVPSVTAGILLDIEKLPNGQRDIRRAMTKLDRSFGCHYIGDVIAEYLKLEGNEKRREAVEKIVRKRTHQKGSDAEYRMILEGVDPEYDFGGNEWPPKSTRLAAPPVTSQAPPKQPVPALSFLGF